MRAREHGADADPRQQHADDRETLASAVRALAAKQFKRIAAAGLRDVLQGCAPTLVAFVDMGVATEQVVYELPRRAALAGEDERRVDLPVESAQLDAILDERLGRLPPLA